MENLGTLGGRVGKVYGISADGQVVVGMSHNAQSNLHGW
jgi:uncharacterized membrane protein